MTLWTDKHYGQLNLFKSFIYFFSSLLKDLLFSSMNETETINEKMYFLLIWGTRGTVKFLT